MTDEQRAELMRTTPERHRAITDRVMALIRSGEWAQVAIVSARIAPPPSPKAPEPEERP